MKINLRIAQFITFSIIAGFLASCVPSEYSQTGTSSNRHLPPSSPSPPRPSSHSSNSTIPILVGAAAVGGLLYAYSKNKSKRKKSYCPCGCGHHSQCSAYKNRHYGQRAYYGNSRRNCNTTYRNHGSYRNNNYGHSNNRNYNTQHKHYPSNRCR